MKKIYLSLFTCFSMSCFAQLSTTALEPIHGVNYQHQAFELPAALDTHESNALPISMMVPLPTGEWIKLALEYAPIMASELREKYPAIKSYKARGEGVHGRVGMTYKGFHGMLFTPKGTVYIDPVGAKLDAYHSYYRDDFIAAKGVKEGHRCLVSGEEVSSATINHGGAQAARSGETLRKYRLALACTGEYAQYHGGTVSGALSAMVVTMNRVNGVYERDFAITMELIANNDDIIYLDGSSDPYTNNSGGTMLGENQNNLNSVIGSANYDIGHVFSTGGGGIASLGSVCSFQNKARGVTGGGSPTGDPFDIDYVAHEMGHQFGANHTQNNNCNRSSSHAYEPGSASTIMGYAGICAPNLQNNSDDYFHAHSYDEVMAFVETGNGGSCATTSNTGNSAPVVTVPEGGWVIPIETPFRLTGSATDANGDDLTYCWEQMDLGPSSHPDSPIGNAPIFRSWDPKEVPYRVFPQMINVVIGNTVTGETYPTYDRDLSFRLTVRDENTAGGGVGFDELEFEVSEDAGPFIVTSPASGASVESVNGYNIEWDVANTDLPPVSCDSVHIELCKFNVATQVMETIDTLARATANDGSETVFIDAAFVGGGYYIRVSAADNVFFNINGGMFSIIQAQALDSAEILLSLTPNYDSARMELSWNDDFTNEIGWYVQRDNGSGTFDIIDSLPANSTNFFDTAVVMYGEVYTYRVNAFNAVSGSDFSNEVEYNGLSTAVAENAVVRIFPNPTTGKIELSNLEVHATATIYNAVGQRCMQMDVDPRQTVDLSGLAPGQYIFTLEAGGVQMVSEQIQIIR